MIGAILGLGSLGACAATGGPPGEPEVRWEGVEKIGGVSLSAPRSPIPAQALAPAAELGANWMAVIPYAFVNPEEPTVVFNLERQFWGESAGGVATTVEHARAHGMDILLKPHLWVRGQGWPGEFRPDDEAGWETFLATYRDYILSFARLADSLDVPMFSVGTEVDVVAVERPEYWRELIAEIREFYDGTLTYAANWDEYQNIEFWDALDLVGVDAYFPLIDHVTPTVENLVAAWKPWEEELAAVARRVNRPILFAEYGYRSIDGAAGEHWKLPENRDAHGIPPNFEAQAAAYEALFRVWWDRPWFAGGFLWKWHPGSPEEAPQTTDYSPQGKPAQAVISQWYRAAHADPSDGDGS